MKTFLAPELSPKRCLIFHTGYVPPVDGGSASGVVPRIGRHHAERTFGNSPQAAPRGIRGRPRTRWSGQHMIVGALVTGPSPTDPTCLFASQLSLSTCRSGLLSDAGHTVPA